MYDVHIHIRVDIQASFSLKDKNIYSIEYGDLKPRARVVSSCSRFWRKFKHYSIIKRQMLRVVIDFIISYYRHYIHQNWGLPRNQSSRQIDKYFVNFILPFAAERICPPVHRGTAKITNLKIVKDCSFVINSGAVTMVDFPAKAQP